jgi:hypothetical protein
MTVYRYRRTSAKLRVKKSRSAKSWEAWKVEEREKFLERKRLMHKCKIYGSKKSVKAQAWGVSPGIMEVQVQRLKKAHAQLWLVDTNRQKMSRRRLHIYCNKMLTVQSLLKKIISID